MSTCEVCGKPYSEHGGMGAACPPRARDKSVACVVDIASRAAEVSGDLFSLTARRETLGGVEHVRLVTDPVSVLLPLSAFRHVVAWTGAADQKLAKLAFSFWRDSEEEAAKLLRLLAAAQPVVCSMQCVAGDASVVHSKHCLAMMEALRNEDV